MHKAAASSLVVLSFSAFAANGIELDGSSKSDVHDEPFGITEIVAPDDLTWDKLRKLRADIRAVLPKLAQCHKNLDDCTVAERRFESIVREAESHRGLAQIYVVNSMINVAIRYTPDMKQWGVRDHWSAPIDSNKLGSFDTGVGDCEDYVIAKYIALRQVGIAGADMRIVLLRDNFFNADHAILTVRSEGRWRILDNRWDTLYDDEDNILKRRFEPLTIIDTRGVELVVKFFRLNDWKKK